MQKKLQIENVTEQKQEKTFVATVYMMLEYIRCKNYSEFYAEKAATLDDVLVSKVINNSIYDYISLAKNSVTEILAKSKYEEGLFSYLKGKIDKDKPVILLMDKNEHCILAYGYDDVEKIIFTHDPSDQLARLHFKEGKVNGKYVAMDASATSAQTVSLDYVYNLKTDMHVREA